MSQVQEHSVPNGSHFFPAGLPPHLQKRRNLKPLRPNLRKPSSSKDHWFWGLGQATAKIRREISVAGKHPVHTVLIGETGTGKEFIARELYRQRFDHMGFLESECPFVAVNSGAIPEALAESILFGHERGAFTSARERQYGKFELAKKGTLFLDEIQSLPLPTQVKLLRVLQTGELERLGGKSPAKIECQVIAASNIPLEILVEKGLFRKDLYYRLNVCPIYIPALRHRKEDLPILIKGLLQKLREAHSIRATEVSPEAFDLFLQYGWPGNIRELEHSLLYAALRTQGPIDVEHLPASLTGQLEAYLSSGTWGA